MAVLELKPAEYATLETELEKELPYSIYAFSHLKLLRRGLVAEKAVLVDSWPDFSAVVIVDSKRRKSVPYPVSFCKRPDFCQTLEILLRHAFKVLESPLYIAGCTSTVMDALVKSFRDAETCPVQLLNKGVAFTFPPDKIVPLEIPEGFRFSELKQLHVENVYNSMDYQETYEQHGDLRCWIRYHISNFQTVSIETDDGRPVAWELQQEYGGLGMLYVEPEYRGAKLGSIVTRALARKLVDDGQLVFAVSRDTNETSINFHEKNGFVRMPFHTAFAFYNL